MCGHEDYSCICYSNDGKIKCSLHGSYFDLVTGQPTCVLADELIQTYPVKVEAGQVWVQV